MCFVFYVTIAEEWHGNVAQKVRRKGFNSFSGIDSSVTIRRLRPRLVAFEDDSSAFAAALIIESSAAVTTFE